MRFTGRVIRSSGRGTELGYPTLNIDLEDIPPELEEGIYACMANDHPAVMHYGPRPVFKAGPSCEVHLLDLALSSPPPSVTIDVKTKIRDVEDFPTKEALKEKISKDIEQARAILSLP